VGLPNAGKSTLLSRLSAARPKVASYPFTTLEPHLGVVQIPGSSFGTLVMADIPGLIEGAHEGAGLGHQFLRHVERCRVLAHLVDLADAEPMERRVEAILTELEAYDPQLARRPWLLVGTKADAVAPAELREIMEELEALARAKGAALVVISAATGQGLDDLVHRLAAMVEQEKGRA